MAEKRDLDLVEVAPKANPPVCKIMDYGRYKYELTKNCRKQKETSLISGKRNKNTAKNR